MRARGDRVAASDDRGAAAVEFALVVGPLILIVVGILDFGFVFGQQLALNNGVRQGAREAVVVGGQTSCADVVASVRGATSSVAMNSSNINVTVQTQKADGTAGSSPCGGSANPTSTAVVCENSLRDDGTLDSILVSASYVSDLVVPWPGPGVPNSLTLESKAVYKCEFS